MSEDMTSNLRPVSEPVVFDGAYTDEAALEGDRGASARAAAPGLRTIPLQQPVRGPMGEFDTAIRAGSLPEGAELVREEDQVVGFLTDRLYVMPHASGREEADAA